ncbi:MAG: folylpolyglutamate synthase/dihydrofolate synthase family protein [Acholeplasmataceae bacterium]
MNFDNLKDALYWVETQAQFRPKTDLSKINQALNLSKLNLSKIRKIHVGGTNGKGSVCAYLSYILMEAGYRVGTFTSPYLVVFNERIRVDMTNINDDDLLNLIDEVYQFNQKFFAIYNESLSFFELITIMSLIHFERSNVDAIIMEVGLGGLLDTTNALEYDLSLITNIGFDHMKQLGYTLMSIADNKLGIVKKNAHLITTVAPDLVDHFQNHVKDVGATMEWINDDQIELLKSLPLVFSLDGEVYQSNLLGDYQMKNASLAIRAIKYFDPSISIEKVKTGLLKTKWSARMEKIDPNLNIYLDGAHNEHAIKGLINNLDLMFPKQKRLVIFSALADKDIEKMLSMIEPHFEHVYLTAFADFRFQPLDKFVNAKRSYHPNALELYNNLKTKLDHDTVLIVTGSLHFVGYMYKQIK